GGGYELSLCGGPARLPRRPDRDRYPDAAPDRLSACAWLDGAARHTELRPPPCRGAARAWNRPRGAAASPRLLRRRGGRREPGDARQARDGARNRRLRLLRPGRG